jgi:tetratricopeptide (TPR) repeat protein
MAKMADALINKAIDQRKLKNFEEALALAIAATEAAPDNANAWWQVSLNQWLLNDLNGALSSLKKTTIHAPQFDGAWSLLGRVYSKLGDEQQAKEAFENALKLDLNNIDALEGLARFYESSSDEGHLDDELAVLTQIEILSGLSSFQRNRIGILHYRRRHYFEAIKYWRQDAATADDPASMFNLGLAYSNVEVSQDADAVDIWRLTLRRFPSYEPSKKALGNTIPKLLTLARKARSQGETILPNELWYLHYLNPFQLLNFPNHLNFSDIDTRLIQRLRKSLLQEIELEEGSLPWMPEIAIDKSRAIAACEELNNESKRNFHWHVFRNRTLLNFLGTAAHDHFLVDEAASPLDTIELLDVNESGFREWLTQPFIEQYEKVLSRAIDSRNIVILECLLDGRRWILPSHEDRCFENAHRLVGRILTPLISARDDAYRIAPTIEQLELLLKRDQIVEILNLLPTYFQDHQNSAVTAIRDIAIACFNKYGNGDLSRAVLSLTKRFRFKSAKLNQMLEADFIKIEELIREEKKDEARKTVGSVPWSITKESVKKGEKVILTKDVTTLRWGVTVSKEFLVTWCDFLLAVSDNEGQLVFTWKVSQDIEENQKHFGDLVNAALTYLFPVVAEKIDASLADGKSVRIGECSISSSGINFETRGWLFADKHFVPWKRATAKIEHGEVLVSDASNRKAKISLLMRDIPNAVVLGILIDAKSKKVG